MHIYPRQTFSMATVDTTTEPFSPEDGFAPLLIDGQFTINPKRSDPYLSAPLLSLYSASHIILSGFSFCSLTTSSDFSLYCYRLPSVSKVWSKRIVTWKWNFKCMLYTSLWIWGNICFILSFLKPTQRDTLHSLN